MSNVSQWNTAAASNNSAPPDGWPEGMAPSTVNDAAREVMAAVARQYQDAAGGLTTAGSGNAYTLTTNNVHAALADQGLIVFLADRANTGSATLNVDSLGAKTLQVNGSNLASGDVVINTLYAVAYNSTNDTYDLLNALVGVGAVGAKDTINNDDWSGADLTVVNGGTGASDVATAQTNLSVAADDFANVDYTGLTSVEGNALAEGDDFLVMDDTTPKRIPYSSAGFPVNTVTDTTDTLGSSDINTYIEYTNAAAVAVSLNTGFGVAGNWIAIEQAGAGQVTISGTATANASVGLNTRTQYSVVYLICKGSNVWTVTGDASA